MKISIMVQNTTTGEFPFSATAPDIDSAISELGRLQRIMDQGQKCLYCGEFTQDVNAICSENCGEQHTLNINENNND